ncbi:anti-sigma factor RsiW [Pantoea ananatis]|uniref:anti-sigma factor family protein n=1 Tax=Pantoea ananas TaxID=553 RepID=UPI000DC233B4|nr:hypothetical protein [Pantoea ananatis]RAR69614.1 anti-sigma factor RsiW [Pantoea ananatis]
MNTLRFAPPFSDEALVAWLDGEMNPDDARRLELLLETDAELAERIDELMKSQLDFDTAFAPLLDKAPEAKMQRRLDALLNAPAQASAADVVATATSGISRRSLIAASLSFLMIGSGLGYLARPAKTRLSESEKIRDLEAQYMSLYSAETLLDADNSPAALQHGLARTAQDIGLHLNTQQLSLPDAELKMVRMLRYDSTSIAQIAWIHAEYGPMALCISPDAQPASTGLQREQRHDMRLVWWHHGGYQFVLIGRNPDEALASSASALKNALSA